MKIIIVGGGIGGLATYHSLRKYAPSIDVKVYEAYPTSLASTSVIGGGLGVVPNGLRALKAISPAALENLYANGFVTTHFTVRNDQGTTLGKLGGEGDRVMMSRAHVHESLLLDVPIGVVEWNKKVKEIQEESNGPRVLFEDGQVEECDLIIGADGVRSICRQELFGKEAFVPTYDGLTAIGGFVTLSCLSSTLQAGIQQDQAAMTFSRNGFFGYSLSLPASTPPDLQQVMWWSTYAVDTPPEREPPVEDLHRLLSAKLQGWKSPWGPAFKEIIDNACSPFTPASPGRFNKWLVLPRFQTERLVSWTSLEKRVILMGDAAHTMSPDSGQGASQALEDAQMLGMLLGHYLPEGQVDQKTVTTVLTKVCKAYETLRIPRVGRILDMGKRQGDGKRQISWFRAKLRDFFLWLMCHLPISWLLKINPTHLYNVEVEVQKYLASQESGN